MAVGLVARWPPRRLRIDPKGHHDLYQKASSGAGPEDVLLADDVNKYPESWSPDGRFLLYMTSGPTGLERILRSLGLAPVRRSQALSVHRVAVYRRREPVFSRRPLGGVQLERVRTIRGVRCAVPRSGGEGADLDGWRRQRAVAPRRQRDLLPRRQHADGSGGDSEWVALRRGGGAAPVRGTRGRRVLAV